MASAAFTVNSSPVTDAVAVTASSTVNLALASTTGVNSVAWSVVGNHSPLAVDPTITPAGSPSGSTASFTMPAGAAQAYLVKCVINGGRDASGNIVGEWTATAVIGVLNASGIVPFAAGETLERSATHGYTAALNQLSTGAGSTALDWKASVRAATTAALPTNNRSGNVLTAVANGAMPAQDSITLAVNEELLVKDEASGENNGIYIVTAVGDGSNPWVLTRRGDADADAEVTAGLAVAVVEGATYLGKVFICTTPDPIVVNTTALTFTELSGAGLTAPANPADDGKFARASGGDLTYIGGSAAGQVVTWNGTAWAAGAVDLADTDAVTNDLPIANLASGAANTVLRTNSGGTAAEYALLQNANVDAAAAIAVTKLANGTADQIVKTNSGGTALEHGKIANANVDAAAAIAVTKIANGTANYVVKTNSGGTALEHGLIGNANIDASAAVAVTKLALGGANQVLWSNGSANSWTGTPTISTLALTGSSIQFASTVTAPTISMATHATTPQTLKLQAANVTTGTGSNLELVSGTGSVAAGEVFLKQGTTTVFQSLGSNTYVVAASSARLQAGGTDRLLAGTTSIQIQPTTLTWLATSTTPTLTQADVTTASATGATLTVQAQNATGTTSTGGALVLASGTGTSAAGQVTIKAGTVNGFSCTATDASVLSVTAQLNGSSTSRIQVNGSNYITCASALITNHGFAINWSSGEPTIRKAGTDVFNTSGNSTFVTGAVVAALRIVATEVMCEATEVATGRSVLSLCRGSALTTTQMPANTGDRVVYVGNAATVPTADPVGGGIYYCEGGAYKYRGTSGTITTLAAA